MRRFFFLRLISAQGYLRRFYGGRCRIVFCFFFVFFICIFYLSWQILSESAIFRQIPSQNRFIKPSLQISHCCPDFTILTFSSRLPKIYFRFTNRGISLPFSFHSFFLYIIFYCNFFLAIAEFILYRSKSQILNIAREFPIFSRADLDNDSQQSNERLFRKIVDYILASLFTRGIDWF